MKLGVLLVLLLASCASSPKAQDPTFARIAALEDARTTNGGELASLLHDADWLVRERAATALGRMPFPDVGADVTRALLEALFEPHPNVRAAAAFALGVRGDPSAADKLLFVALDHHQADADALVRARALEAASKLDRPELRESVLEGLFDSGARVRLEVAQGTSRWPTTEPNASAINQRLVDSLATEQDRHVILYTLFALERRKAKEAISAFEAFDHSDDRKLRLFAVRGLKALAPDPRTLAPLHAATANVAQRETEVDGVRSVEEVHQDDPRVRCEALLGLASFRDAKGREFALQAFAHGTGDLDPHVRRCAWEGFGTYLDGADDAAFTAAFELFESMPVAWDATWVWPDHSVEPSASVRAAALEAMAPTLHRSVPQPVRQASMATLNGALDYDASPIVLAGLCRGLAKLPTEFAVELLQRLARHHEVTVREAAIEALGKHPSPQVRLLLLELLADRDNGVRLSAVLALAEMPDTSNLEPLERCFRSSNGDISAEIKFNVLRSVAKIGGGRAIALLARGTDDANAFVRKVAREELAKLDPKDPAAVAPAAVSSARPIVDLELPTYRENPLVDVVTTRGTMRFELFPDETPVHVASFLALVAQGRYTNTLWHRVVPDFVIQGGDYRGDGNGGGTWKGPTESLRHEFTPRKYVRGSLGMPRNEDPDSGGSQIFVTHRPTPHLDGRYTLFGELRKGFEVLDAIEVGDRILEIRRVR